MDTKTEFFLSGTSSDRARALFGTWRCRIERMDSTSCNIVFFDREEVDRFEQFAEENDLEYTLV